MTRYCLPDRAVLRINGADTRPFLQGLLTQDVMQLAPGHPLYAGLLSAQGKLLFSMLLHKDAAGDVLVDVDIAQADALARRLGLYRMRKAVTIAPAPDLAVHVALEGGHDHPADPRLAALGSRWLAAPGDAPDGIDAWRAHRTALGVAEAAELGEDRLLWLETGAALLNGVSFTKGCYVGQENTARMHHRDKVRRMIVPLRIDGSPGDGKLGDGQLRDPDGRVVGSLLGAACAANGVALAHMRLEAGVAALTVGDGTPATLLRPDWLAPVLEGAN
ncbi:CAF17-like 4Fe-4S cluster assembly/insertion protein YgfZ [Polymorphobacter sp.]|uniref:CAF17-like 4Fe-4S cluster assembly/insertion protein YgfZ n=1 Tax=Polymorphobacter sp. TaxID=1909290 RepID=UPI003F6FAD11